MNKPLLCLLICFFTCTAVAAGQTAAEVRQGNLHFRQALQAEQNGNHELFLEEIRIADRLRPMHPGIMINLAAAYAANHDTSNALQTLAAFAEMKCILPSLRDSAFNSIRQTRRFRNIVRKAGRNEEPTARMRTVFQLARPDLLIEDIAYSSSDSSYYLSSVHQQQLIRYRQQSSKVILDKTDGLWSLLGVQIDPADSTHLWAASAALPQGAYTVSADYGSSEILKINLPDQTVEKRFTMEDDQKTEHLFGDLEAGPDSSWFVSDSKAAIVYQLQPANGSFKAVTQPEQLISPQGLVYSDSSKYLLIADYSMGIVRLNLKTGKLTTLQNRSGTTLLSIDGFYSYQGDLIAIQNGINPHRVVRLTLDNPEDPTAITDFKVLAANHDDMNDPTLGTIIGKHFLFNANSQWQLFHPDREQADSGAQPPVIIAVPLD